MQDLAAMSEQPTALQILEQWDFGSKYVAIKDKSHYAKVIAQCAKFPDISLDTETTGVIAAVAQCLGYSFAVEPHRAFWVPIKVDPQMKLLRQLIAKKHLVLFNAAYDLAIIQNHARFKVKNQISDMMIACFFRDIDGYKHRAGLKPQGKLLFNTPTVEMKEIIMANKGVKRLSDDDVRFLDLTSDQQRVYGCQDADLTIRMWQHPEIQNAIESMPEIWTLEHRLIPVVMEMMQNGIKVDLKKVMEFDGILEKACEQCTKDVTQTVMDELERQGDVVSMRKPKAELLRLMGKSKTINLGSFPQKQIALFQICGIPLTKKTESGGYSTDHDALTSLVDAHPVVGQVLRYMKYKSRRSSYTTKLPDMIQAKTGRLHPSLWATGVKSGRFSCSQPNMQGVSRDQEADDVVHIRDIFIAEKGNVITDADYNQIELRIAASASQEPLLCSSYQNGIDLHSRMAFEIMTIKGDKPEPAQRQVAKTANFSILTGIGPHKFHSENPKIIPSVEFAKEIIAKWFKAMPILSAWIEEKKREARHDGYAYTEFGRIRPFPDIKQPSEALIDQRIVDFSIEAWALDYSRNDLREIARRSIVSGFERKALSHYIQGTAADIMKMALCKLNEVLVKSKLPIKLLLTVHDEVLLEHPSRLTNKAHAILQESMSDHIMTKLDDTWVPLVVNIGTGKTWAQAK